MRFISFFLLLFTAFFVSPISANNVPEQNLTIILDWFINPDHAPLFVADQQGFFKQQGLNIKFIMPADPADPPKLVAAGKADLAITYQPQMLMQIHQGLPLTPIAVLINHPLDCLAVLKTSPIKSIADLKNKKIGYSLDSTDSAVLASMLATQKLTSKDVQLINIRYGLTQALLSKQVDAVIGIVRNFEPIEMELAGQPARIFLVEDYGVPNYNEFILVANSNKIADPRFNKFVTALTQGVNYLKQHPEETWQAFAKAHPELNNELNHRAWFATLPYFANNPKDLDPKREQEVRIFLKKWALI